jgi:transcriptional regulator with XRE-family HTH domain
MRESGRGRPERREDPRLDTVGARIRYVRLQRGLTLDRLAQQAELSKSFLWEVEQNRSGISGEKLLRVANVLRVSLDFLLRGEPLPEQAQSGAVAIPHELGELAEELGLSYRQTLVLSEIGRSVLARRSTKQRGPMTRDDWRRLYDGVRPFLEEKA